MIIKKEFYFVRHGQTDSNAANLKADHSDEPLNAVGRQQAQRIEPLVASLPVTAICHSPLQRARETKEIVTAKLALANYSISLLGECTFQIWNDMTRRGSYIYHHDAVHVQQFMDRVYRGLNEALLLVDGPPLIVAHGGVHWAICTLLAITEHDWLIDNCLPVRFYPDTSGCWKAKKLI